MKKKDIRDRLFKITSDFKESQKEKPVPISEQWYQESPEEYESAKEHEFDFSEKREHLRKDISVYGIFETKESQFRASTKNVSMGGVLIDPETHLSFHEDLYMTFFHRKFNIPVKTFGKVVRVDSYGVGIQFDQAIPAISSLLS